MASRVRSERLQQDLPFAAGVQGAKQKLFAELRPILLIGGVVLFGLLLYVWQHIQVVRLGYQIERLRTARAALIQEGKVLNVELSRLRSVKRVEGLARRELGMGNPAPGQIILLEEHP